MSDINGGEFGTWITLPNVKLLTGDFNADRVTDLALTGPSGWGSVPMLLSVNGTGSFTVVNAPVNMFAAWSASSGANHSSCRPLTSSEPADSAIRPSGRGLASGRSTIRVARSTASPGAVLI